MYRTAIYSGMNFYVENVSTETVKMDLRRKKAYKEQMEEQLQITSAMSEGAIFGHKSTETETHGDDKWANDLNQFLNRFDQAPALNQSPCHSPSGHYVGKEPAEEEEGEDGSRLGLHQLPGPWDLP